uniref:Aspartic proteinase-like protein 2 n=1 Tax=Tanacetum cinerariifolium TaxID=118510 RepID=A0A699IH19_TANCI|nr:aspartic proteinase-like protein 2 [Tanacetum cinerariifolium]
MHANLYDNMTSKDNHPVAQYNVKLKAIEVAGDVLQLPTNIFDVREKRGTIIDSGTTLAYLPDMVYKQVLEKDQAGVSVFRTTTCNRREKNNYAGR